MEGRPASVLDFTGLAQKGGAVLAHVRIAQRGGQVHQGRVEVVVVNMHERPSLLKISGENANAILVRALTSTGRDAIGARLTATTGGMSQIDEVRSGGLYISQPDFRVHFGLASAATVDLAVPAGHDFLLGGHLVC